MTDKKDIMTDKKLEKIKNKALDDNRELAVKLSKIHDKIDKLEKNSDDIAELKTLNKKLEKVKKSLKDNVKTALKDVNTKDDCKLEFLDLKITISANPENVSFNVNKLQIDTKTDKKLFKLYNKYLTPSIVWKCTFNK